MLVSLYLCNPPLILMQGRIMCAPFFDVTFADFWLADQLTSLSLAMLDAEYFFCYLFYTRNAPGRLENTSVFMSVSSVQNNQYVYVGIPLISFCHSSQLKDALMSKPVSYVVQRSVHMMYISVGVQVSTLLSILGIHV